MNGNSYRLEMHDRYQVELKCDYAIQPTPKRKSIRLEWFLFMPTSLGIDADNYGKDRFYQDLTVYTRYGTPGLTLAEILDSSNELSPLTRLESMRAKLATGEATEEVLQKVAYELRILACIARARIRDETLKIIGLPSGEEESDGAHDVDPSEAVRICEKLLDQIAELSRRVRNLKPAFVGPGRPPELMRVFELEDEALSVHLEEHCGRLYQAFQKLVAATSSASDVGEARKVAGRLAHTMAEEERHRLHACYPTQVDAARGPAAKRGNEFYIHRGGHLKKFAQSLLFLSVHTRQGSRTTTYSLNAVAAMAAMLFYLAAVILILENPQSTSIPAIALLVIAYAFKDRIKEGLKSYFSSRMTGWLRDRNNNLVDRGPTGRIVGRAAEAFSFIAPERVPEDVLAVRDRDPLEELAEEGAPEVVLKYERALELNAGLVARIHERITRINEILRFSVRSLLYRMDEPHKPLVILKSDGRSTQVHAGNVEADAADLPALIPIRAAKVYHAHLVVRLSSIDPSGKWTDEMKMFRLVLSRKGIRRIEEENGRSLATER